MLNDLLFLILLFFITRLSTLIEGENRVTLFELLIERRYDYRIFWPVLIYDTLTVFFIVMRLYLLLVVSKSTLA